MSDTSEAKPPSKLRWLQISLRTLLAVVLGFGLGLAVNYQFRTEESKLPHPGRVRPGDVLRVQWKPNIGEWSSFHTVTVLADGTIRLRELGGVPAAGMSLDELTEDLKTRYLAYAKNRYAYPVKSVEVFVDFGQPAASE